MATDSADELLRQMRKTRREISAGAEDIAEKARDMTDWKSYVRAHPWLCMGAAATLGYLLVPPKVHVSATSLEPVMKLMKDTQDLVRTHGAPPPEPRTNWLSSLATTLASHLLRTGLGIVGDQVSRLVQSQLHSNGHAKTFNDHIPHG